MRKTLSRALAVVLVGGASVLGLALDPATIVPSDAAAPSAVQPMLHGEIPTYPGVQELDIGRGLNVNGQTVDMHQFFTSDTPEDVSEYYARAFDESFPGEVMHHRAGNAHHVSVVTEEGRFLQVMIIAEPDGGSLVVPNVATGPLRPGHEAKELPVPLPASHSALMTFTSTDGGKNSISAQFVTLLGLVEIAEFYRAELPPLGFIQAPGAVAPPELADNGVLRFRANDGRLVSIGAQGLEGSEGCLVHILHEAPYAGADR